MVESNYKAIDLNSLTTNIMATEQGEDETQEPSFEVIPKFTEYD
jgi:hypothetical protein